MFLSSHGDTMDKRMIHVARMIIDAEPKMPQLSFGSAVLCSRYHELSKTCTVICKSSWFVSALLSYRYGHTNTSPSAGHQLREAHMAMSCMGQTRWMIPLLASSSVASRYVVTIKVCTYWFATFIFVLCISLWYPTLQPRRKGCNPCNYYRVFKSEFDCLAIGDVTCTPYTQVRLDAHASMDLPSLYLRDK